MHEKILGNMPFSECVSNVGEFPVRAIFNLVARSKDIINLSIGELDLATPACVKEAAEEAIALKLKRDNSVDVDPENVVMLTVGANQAIFRLNRLTP